MLSATLSSEVKRLINAFEIVSKVKIRLKSHFIFFRFKTWIIYFHLVQNENLQIIYFGLRIMNDLIQTVFHNWKEHFDFWFDLNDVSKVALKCLFDHQHAPVNILKKNTKAENRIYFIRVKCYVIFCWKIFRKKDLNTHIFMSIFSFCFKATWICVKLAKS